VEELTAREQKIYDFIADVTASKGFPPSIREICDGVGLKSPSSVHFYLKSLEDKGYITKERRRTRAINLAGDRYTRVPLLGRVTAGQPILALENIEGYLPFDAGRKQGEFFALTVLGESMIGAGIFDGDIVVVRRQTSAENGQIVVALLEDEATVKRLKLTPAGPVLQPENPLYSPIDGRSASILGAVVALVRNYS